ncbi:MAG: stage III sporulation protein AF [Oscillospiraceae bacterium]|nr:stage III sporulation protein AF [Oscillospiraceae bacterium]MDD3261484.1 stage III sporulation protein AF [Oscillospiraceae bacterium]
MIRAWAGGLCALAVAAAMIRFLAPDGSMRKMLRLIMGAVVLCAIINPLLQTIPKLSSAQQQRTSSTAVSDFTKLVQQQEESAVQKQTESIAAAALQHAGIPYSKIDTQLQCTSGNRTCTVSVLVTLPQGGNIQRAKALLKETLGVDVEVTSSG